MKTFNDGKHTCGKFFLFFSNELRLKRKEYLHVELFCGVKRKKKQSEFRIKF